MNTELRAGLLVGPTAVGKSAVAMEIAQQLAAEIVNADSRQVYRGMDVGTAKPRADELRRVRHHLIDIRDPDMPLDAAEFAGLAHGAIAEIAARGRRVLVVGGSGLYLRAIKNGIFAAPPASPEIRARLTTLANHQGVGYLFERLREVDPVAAAWVSPNDLRRIVRALEVHEQTGIAISELQRRHQSAGPLIRALTIGLTLPRERLYQAIDQRFDAMVEQGLVEEVRMLLTKEQSRAGLPVHRGGDGTIQRDPMALPLATIGYREIAEFLNGHMSLAAAIERAKRASRRLAKRQLTWFRADPEIIWLDAAREAGRALKLFQNFLLDQMADAPKISGAIQQRQAANGGSANTLRQPT